MIQTGTHVGSWNFQGEDLTIESSCRALGPEILHNLHMNKSYPLHEGWQENGMPG